MSIRQKLFQLIFSQILTTRIVAELGSELSNIMRKRTGNFRIGFGSFVDKVQMPFVSTAPSKLQKPCDEREEGDFKCAPPFSYRHSLSLTSDIQQFKTEVERAAVSGNLDSPEGGFDAIMQAVVCAQEIGWRKDARKLLMFSTDASFHFAGDGKLGGILIPNDGKCHMDGNGEYTHSTILDYPSISQINSKVTEKSIGIIFAVTQDQLPVYEKLSKQIQGSTAGELSKNSSNLVELLNQEYDKITSEVKLSHSLEDGSPLDISFSSLCSGGLRNEDGRCSGVKIGETVEFNATLLLTTCPPGRRFWSKSFEIQVVGLEEKLKVDLEFICGCDCEYPGNEGYERRSHSCGLEGTNMCGVCDCENTGYYGKFCECSSEGKNKNNEDNSVLDPLECKEENSTTVCSDRGECVCGKCECWKLPQSTTDRYLGKYCQCENLSCRRINGILCSGHGNCDCGICKCGLGWEGEGCDCSTSKVNCIGSDSIDEVCSGHGFCNCNRCVCSTGYNGPHCEECETCPDKCIDISPCVLCSIHRNSSDEDKNCLKSCLPYPEIELVEFAPSTGGKYCVGVDVLDGCNYYFTYLYSSQHELIIKGQKTKSCPLLSGSAVGWVMGGSILIGIVIIGLIGLFMFWCYREKKAEKEYAKFNEDALNSKWSRVENPLYRNPNSKFQNPLHEDYGKEN